MLAVYMLEDVKRKRYLIISKVLLSSRVRRLGCNYASSWTVLAAPALPNCIIVIIKVIIIIWSDHSHQALREWTLYMMIATRLSLAYPTFLIDE